MAILSIVPEVEIEYKVTENHEEYTEIILDYSTQITTHMESGGDIDDLELETTWVSRDKLNGEWAKFGVRI